MRSAREIIEILIAKKEEELWEAKVQEWIYMLEAVKPVNITKGKAEEGMAIYQKRIKALEQHIEIYNKYLNEHNL